MAFAQIAGLRLSPTVRLSRGPLRVSSKSGLSAHAAPKPKHRQPVASFAPLVGASMPWLSASSAFAADAGGTFAADVSAALPEGYGLYIASLAPLLLYGIYRTFLSDDRTASAVHILVKDEKTCEDLKTQLAGSSAANLKGDFATLASQYSTCPSKAKGGSLGTFQPGQMVPAFNDIVFNEEVGKVHGPIKTDFGYHLILIENRTNHKTGEKEE